MTASFFDPTGSPGRTYGTSIDTVNGNGTTSGAATAISAPTGWTIVIINTLDGSNRAAILPSAMAVGDIVEAYSTQETSGTAILFLPSGEGWLAGGTASIAVGNTNSGVLLRKLTATQWVVMGAAA